MREKRSQRLEFWVNSQEREHIEKRMGLVHCGNMASYLRRMALHGYMIHLELPELRECVTLLRRASNNINQIAKRVNETSRVYEADLVQIQSAQAELWALLRQIIEKLAAIQ